MAGEFLSYLKLPLDTFKAATKAEISGTVGMVVLAGVTSYQVGKIIDKHTGISGWIGGNVADLTVAGDVKSNALGYSVLETLALMSIKDPTKRLTFDEAVKRSSADHGIKEEEEIKEGVDVLSKSNICNAKRRKSDFEHCFAGSISATSSQRFHRIAKFG